MTRDNLGNRMKAYYEEVPNLKLTRKTPVALRLDGKAFHTLTRNFKKPYDEVFHNAMNQTMKYLCENIQGCVFGYTQSDEITLILVDYQTPETSAWFDYKVQKLCSIAASMTTMAFNRIFGDEVSEEFESMFEEFLPNGELNPNFNSKEVKKLVQAHNDALSKGAMFDARCFNIPKEEVGNLILWRQMDATRNSIQMLGRCYFSCKELQNKNCTQIKEMLLKKGIDWDKEKNSFKWGTACYKVKGEPHDKWYIDENMPVLKEDWDFINRWVFVKD